MPLCTIFAKCPAPLAPQCSHPRSGAGASASSIGLDPRNGVGAAADHETVAVGEPPHAARHARVDELQAVRRPGARRGAGCRDTRRSRRRRSHRRAKAGPACARAPARSARPPAASSTPPAVPAARRRALPAFPRCGSAVPPQARSAHPPPCPTRSPRARRGQSAGSCFRPCVPARSCRTSSSREFPSSV